MKKLLLFFFTICAPYFINAAEPPAEETLHETITVTVKWYDNTPWTGYRGAFEQSDKLYRSEMIHEYEIKHQRNTPLYIRQARLPDKRITVSS